MSWMAALGIGGALLGGIAGSQGTRQTNRRALGPAGATENAADALTLDQLKQLQALTGSLGGASELQQSNRVSNDLANRLEMLSRQGLRPEQVDIETARAQLAPQRTLLDQSFEDEQTRAARLAAQLNRPINDPIIQAKLSQERMRGLERLGAQESSGAFQSALQRLGFLGQGADIRQQLGAQALQNRIAIASLGSNVKSAQFNQRYQSAPSTQTTGGGLAGALTGALGGAGSAFSIGSGLGFNKANPFSVAPESTDFINRSLQTDNTMNNAQPELMSAFFR